MKIAVITGASSGMGREFVRQIPHFYMNLDELWIISRRKDRLEAIAKTCSVPVRIFAGDLTDPMFLQTVKDTLQRLRPDIRMLVNAAGFGKAVLFWISQKKSGPHKVRWCVSTARH